MTRTAKWLIAISIPPGFACAMWIILSKADCGRVNIGAEIPKESSTAFELEIVAPKLLRAITFSGKDDHIVGVAYDTIWSWSIQGQLIAMQRLNSPITCVAYVPNTDLIVVGTNSKCVQFLKETNLALVGQLEIPSSTGCFRIACDSNGNRIAVTPIPRNARVFIVDIAQMDVLATIVNDHDILLDSKFRFDGRALACLDGDGKLALWEIENGVNRRFLADAEDAAEILIGKQIIAGVCQNGIVCMSVDGRPEHSFSFVGLESHDLKGAFLVSNGQQLLTLHGGLPTGPSALAVWNMRSGLRQVLIRPHEAGVTAGCVSQDGERVATTGHDRKVRIWSLQKSAIQSMPQQSGNHLISAAPSVDIFAPKWKTKASHQQPR